MILDTRVELTVIFCYQFKYNLSQNGSLDNDFITPKNCKKNFNFYILQTLEAL